MKIDYMVHVRLVIGIGLLLAGFVSLWLDQSYSQLLFSTLALVLGVLFIVLGLRPEKQQKENFQLEEKDEVKDE